MKKTKLLEYNCEVLARQTSEGYHNLSPITLMRTGSA